MTRKGLVLIAAGGSAALLAGAFLFQALGYAPCKLCLWQRWPHAAAIVAGLAFFATNARFLTWIGALSAGLTGAIGIYHTGVELRWWEGPSTCTSSGNLSGSAEDLMRQIMEAPLIRCDEVAWSLFGLSMASWNAILSFALMAVWIMAARRGAKA
ncbi:disulfide bond formation protein DsbB [Albidovulum inexpectatum]|uniref:Disulfide bond formation protein DsbB n=1 Tax=Albidovulum inexpectatum TaxID=196587 RepID=A0A2S5JJ21_9RHOB|nr:disulfide bond formation protein B [Albidovulum inexpectatum]PPB81504.1 disulfide bond formation protein DsbB [Albidovulum inexpectatum]